MELKESDVCSLSVAAYRTTRTWSTFWPVSSSWKTVHWVGSHFPPATIHPSIHGLFCRHACVCVCAVGTWHRGCLHAHRSGDVPGVVRVAWGYVHPIGGEVVLHTHTHTHTHTHHVGAGMCQSMGVCVHF